MKHSASLVREKKVACTSLRSKHSLTVLNCPCKLCTGREKLAECRINGRLSRVAACDSRNDVEITLDPREHRMQALPAFFKGRVFPCALCFCSTTDLAVNRVRCVGRYASEQIARRWIIACNLVFFANQRCICRPKRRTLPSWLGFFGIVLLYRRHASSAPEELQARCKRYTRTYNLNQHMKRYQICSCECECHCISFTRTQWQAGGWTLNDGLVHTAGFTVVASRHQARGKRAKWGHFLACSAASSTLSTACIRG